jgi:hypothetical protein
MIKLIFGDLVLNVISVYAPQVGLSDDVKRRFWEDLEECLAVKNSSLEEILMVMLAQLERGMRGYMGVCEDILNFAIAYDLMVANTFFRKKKSHLITSNSGQHSSQIDFVLTRRDERPNCMDYKVIPGECVVTQHKFLMADFYFQVCIR